MSDLSSFANALARLVEGVARYQRERHDAHIRDGLIQRFEFTYDLAVKTLRRVVVNLSDDPGASDRMTFGELIRTADDLGLTPLNWPEWKQWRDLRNITSHTYDEVKAEMAAARIPAFETAMTDLIARLRKAMDQRA